MKKMLDSYEITKQRNFYAISVGKYDDLEPVECYKEDAFRLAQGFQLYGSIFNVLRFVLFLSIRCILYKAILSLYASKLEMAIFFSAITAGSL